MFNLLFGSTLSAVLVTNTVVFAATFGWHIVDKHVAVKEALAGMTSKAELAAANAKIDEISRRYAVAQDAVDKLNNDVVAAIEDAERAKKGLEDYVQNTSVNDKCVVDDKLYQRLFNK